MKNWAAPTSCALVPPIYTAESNLNYPSTIMKDSTTTRLALSIALLLGTGSLPAAGSPSLPERNLGRSRDYDYDIPSPGSYVLPPLMPAGDGPVLLTDGNPESLRSLMKGRLTILSFIYTRCPDPRACPMATGALRQLHAISQEDPEIARNLILLTMSFDPTRDTPSLMKSFAKINRRTDQGAPWKFLTTPSPEALAPILKAYDQTIDPRPDDPARRIAHPLRVYLIDEQGMVRNIYSFGMLDPRMVMTDIRTLLMENSKQH